MTPQEADKIIAEFMGLRFVQLCDGESYAQPSDDNYERITYSKSLDALVPVLEKLKDKDFECFCWLNINKGTNSCEWKMNSRHGIEENESPSVALAIATAKAIQEMGNGERDGD
jgi:hypothetical protein